VSTYNRVVAADSTASLAPTVRARLATEMADPTSEVGASLSGTFMRALRKVSDLTYPVVLAHKGGANLAPEDTVEAFRSALAYGAQVLDLDVVALLDGTAVVIHDSTLDRTTNVSGNVSDQTAMSWSNLTVDSASWFGGSFGNLHPPLLTDVLKEFGGKVVLQIEAKTAGTAAALARDVVRYGVEDSVILSTAFWAAIPDLVASGAHTRFVMSTGVEKTPTEVAVAGCSGIDVVHNAAAMTEALIGDFHTAGLTVFGYTPDRQADVAVWVAKGGDGWYSDDPVYSAGIQNGYSYRLSKMPFTSQTYYHGHIPGSANIRGVFTPPDGWGISDTVNLGARTNLAGGICPIKGDPDADTFTIDFTIKIESMVDTGRWAGFYVGFDSDDQFNDGATDVGRNGYRCLINGGGSVEIAKYTDGVSVGNVATASSTALSLPATITGKVTVSPTQVILQRTDVAATATANDATYRGGYVHFGMSGVTARFTRFEVTA